MNPPDEIWITDTTFRDGQQSRPPYTIKQIVDLYDLIHKLGGKNGIIRQCEFFLYNEKDQQAVRKCMERGYTYPEITGWIRAVKSDFKLVKEMGLKQNKKTGNGYVPGYCAGCIGRGHYSTVPL